MPISEGIRYLPGKEYYADPCAEPSFSASLAKTILNRSVYHAWLEHPRLGGLNRKPSTAMNFGTAAHEMFLEGSSDSIQIIEHPDYRTKAAKLAKDEAIAAGLTPVLNKEFEVLLEMVGSANDFMGRTEFFDFKKKGEPEQTLISYNECWMRGRVDYISDDRKLIIDYKTSSRPTNPNEFSKTIFNMDYDIQAGMYCYLNKLISNVEAIYIWIVQETEPPYSCFLKGASPFTKRNGLDKALVARGMWAEALKTGEFNSHDTDVDWVDPPRWEVEKTENLIYKFGE